MPYDEIFIFGPGTAKNEFQNYLLKENHFSGKRIIVEDSDYMTSNQQEKHVQKYFGNDSKF